MTATPDLTRPVRLPRRSRQGVVLGMDGWQLTFIAASAVVILISVNRFGPPGLLYAAPIYLALGATAITSIHGISAPRMAGLWVLKRVRHTMVNRPDFRSYREPCPAVAGWPDSWSA